MKKSCNAGSMLLFAIAVLTINLTTAEAAKHVGENAIVCGTVVGVHTAERGNGSPTFVNLDKTYPNQVFTILIWKNDMAKFVPAPSSWNNKSVCATGKIELYRNVPEIVAREADQVSFPK